MNPTATAINEKKRTAPAAKSLMWPAFSWYWGEIKLTISSIAELIISAPITKAMQINKTDHSNALKCRMEAKIITKRAKKLCIRKLCSLKKAYFNPLKAGIKDKNLSRHENVFFILNPKIPVIVSPH